MGERSEIVDKLTERLGDRRKAQQMTAYAGLLETWATTHNLVRYRTREELLERHLLEPLTFSSSLGDRGRLLDVGSGAGLPGVPLLISRPGWSGVLLEPRQKRWAFLRLVIRELELDATCEACRYQDFAGEVDFDLITARAVGGYVDLAGWCRPRLAAGGRLVLWTSEKQEQSLRELPGWRVLSCPMAGLDRGLLLQLEPCFT